MANNTILTPNLGADFFGKVAAPIVAAILYGSYKFVSLGAGTEHLLYTYAAVLGGIAAIAGLGIYLRIVSAPRVSWRSLLVFLGLLPYLYSLYVMGMLGVYPIYGALSGQFSLWSILFGLIWIGLGYRMLNEFYLLTEFVKKGRGNRRCPRD